MEIYFEEDLMIIRSAVENGDTEDALKLIDELRGESIKVLNPDVNQLILN